MIIMGLRLSTPLRYHVLIVWLPNISVWIRLMMITLSLCPPPIMLIVYLAYLWTSIWLSLNGDRIASKVLSLWLMMRVLTGTVII